MPHLTRPRLIGFGGLLDNVHDDASGGGGGNLFDFDFTAPQPGSSWDIGDLASPGSGGQAGPAAPADAGASPFNITKLANDVVKGAQTYYGAQTAINNADYSARLAKARAQAAVNVAKAGGANASLTARAGLPSPTLLLAAGVALGAVLLIRR